MINNLHTMKHFTIAALGLFLTCIASCVVVEERNECDDGALRCDTDIIDECVNGEWRFVEDCFDLCGGVCDFDSRGDPVCVC